jgi:hypothetical protein
MPTKAAVLADILPRALRFTGAKRLLNAFAHQLRRTPGDQIRTMVTAIAAAV